MLSNSRVRILLFFVSAIVICFSIYSKAEASHFRIIHTTDIHGWIDGHRHDDRYQADLGDFLSLVSHVKKLSEEQGVDFHLIDTGDIIQGTGLSDATPVAGSFIYDLMMSIDYTALTLGNHDLADNVVIEQLRKNFIPHWNGHYLALNTFYVAGQAQEELAPPFFNFTTSKGVHILVLGFLYNFDDYPDSVVVQTVEDAVLSDRFLDAMAVQDIDLIYLLGHYGPTSSEAEFLRDTVRLHHPNTSMIMFCGHTHQSHFKELDSRTVYIESFWALKALGVVEFDLDLEKGEFANFSHQFLEPKVDKFREFAQVPSTEPFDTPEGSAMKTRIDDEFNRLNLGHSVAYLNKTWSKKETIGYPDSIYNLLLNELYPRWVFTLTDTNLLLNTGSVRDSLYEGFVILDDLFVVDPFNSSFSFIANVSGELCLEVLHRLMPWSSTLPPPENAQVPHYYLSAYPTVEATLYQLMVTDYDAPRVVAALHNLTGTSWSSQSYPTTYTSFTALKTYLEEFFPLNDTSSVSEQKDRGLDWKQVVGIVSASLVIVAVFCLVCLFSIAWMVQCVRRRIKAKNLEAKVQTDYEALG